MDCILCFRPLAPADATDCGTMHALCAELGRVPHCTSCGEDATTEYGGEPSCQQCAAANKSGDVRLGRYDAVVCPGCRCEVFGYAPDCIDDHDRPWHVACYTAAENHWLVD